MSDVIRLDLKPTVVAARTLVEQEYRLYLGLLSMPCSPEGDGYVELDLPGYSRQAVDFFGEPGRVLLGLSSVRFAFDNEMPVHVQQVAAFDQQGRVVAYCRPTNVVGAKPVLGSVTVRPHDLKLRRC